MKKSTTYWIIGSIGAVVLVALIAVAIWLAIHYSKKNNNNNNNKIIQSWANPSRIWGEWIGSNQQFSRKMGPFVISPASNSGLALTASGSSVNWQKLNEKSISTNQQWYLISTGDAPNSHGQYVAFIGLSSSQILAASGQNLTLVNDGSQGLGFSVNVSSNQQCNGLVLIGNSVNPTDAFFLKATGSGTPAKISQFFSSTSLPTTCTSFDNLMFGVLASTATTTRS